MSNVVELPKSNIEDLPALLEKMASDLRDGVYGAVNMGAVVLMSESGPEVFGLGRDADLMAVIGVLHVGADKLSEIAR